MATNRHRSVHPPSTIKVNPTVNQKPNYVAPEKAAAPNVNPSLGRVGLDAANARVTATSTEIDLPNDNCVDPDDSECEDDRRKPMTFVY